MFLIRTGTIIRGVVPTTLMVSKRHVRRRQPHRETGEPDSSAVDYLSAWTDPTKPITPNVSSLRSEGFMAAPATTSLDKIRLQLAIMRTENMKKLSEEKAAREQQQWLQAQKDLQAKAALRAGVELDKAEETLTSHIQQEYARTNKPNDVFKNGKEILNGVAQRSFLLQQKRFRDADEVLRKSGKEDTGRFVKLAFPPNSEETRQLVQLLRRMREQWSVEKDKLSSSLNLSVGTNDAETLSWVAWLQVLERISDKEVRLLWESSVLDAETLESLFTEPSEETAVKSESSTRGQNSTFQPEDLSRAASLLDEKINYVQRLHYLQELTSEIRETTLVNVPSIDLAPTLVKVQRRQFADITEEELRKLEEYGEAAAVRLSVPGSELQTLSRTDPKPQPLLPKKSPVQIDVPASTLDHALTPSNTFLSAVAEKDASLKRSLEGMERIKREALLDPEFQEAVRFAHAVEEASVAPHLHGQSIGIGGWSRTDEETEKDDGSRPSRAPHRIGSKREHRAARNRQFRGPMARSLYSPEVVPYFYNNMRSIVPPRGVFNLPDPMPTKAERAEYLGRRRRAYKRSQFRK